MMQKQQALVFGFSMLVGLVSNLALAASVTVTLSGSIDHPLNLRNSGEPLQFFGVQQNDPFSIRFIYDDQQMLGNQMTPVQDYAATLGSTTYAFTNPSQIAANGPRVQLNNMNIFGGQSGVEDIAGFSDVQANFSLGLLATAATDLRNFDATQPPLTLSSALFNASFDSTLFFGASNNASNPSSSSISGFISSISLAATPPLSAVPLPGAVWLFISGLIAVLGLKRRASRA